MTNEFSDASTVLTTKRLAVRLGLTKPQLMYLIRSRQVADASQRVGNRRRFSEEEAQAIERFLAERKQESTTAAVQSAA